MNLNAVDIGAAYRSENQDPTLGTSAVPGATAYTTNLLRPYKGLGNVNQHTTEFWDTYHSIQTSLNRRYRNGLAFGFNYTYSISYKGNLYLQKRLQHAADGTISVRSDQADYEKLMENLDRRPHVFKANAGSRRVQLRLDAFNAFNTVVISGRNTTIQYNSPTDLTVLNSETLPDGSIDPARRTPRTAGLGAATNALGMRSLQFQVRVQF